MHVFCDASVKAFCAVAYWRWIDHDENIRVASIASKCRVAGNKPTTVPRLDLQAAVLASRLAETITNEHKMKAVRRVFWSDSTSVLHWIKNNARNYKMYIANRLGEIDELTRIHEWRYVPTKLNIADIATRENYDCSVLQDVWLQGPTFLYKHPEYWPLDVVEPANKELLECVTVIDNTIETCNLPVPEPSRFSSWLRLLRTASRVLTFVDNIIKAINKRKQIASTCNLNDDVMDRAESLLIKHSQALSFGKEIKLLQASTALPTSSKLLTLSPYLDEHGVLRCGGRINAAPEITPDVKQPVVLDGRSHITQLIVKHYHQRAFHGHQEIVVNELKQKYWIVRIRPTVKHVISKCTLCRIRRAQPRPPRMGDLPEGRLAHHQRPFTHTGVDLFGPMEVTIGRRREKRYGVLFTCLTVRAIHVELVGSLTTDDVIMALRRMAARRGWPRHLYSDNGTNLRGADKELKKCVSELDEKLLADGVQSYSMTTTWTFSPPASPHWGGAWERLIRCVKNALKVVLKERAPRDAILQSLMTEVEVMVNSRPLTHVSVEPNTDETLTPNHFLLGSSSNLPTMGTFDESDTFLRKQWRIAQQLADSFWRRWVKEVLPDMRPRKKWQQEQRPLQVCDLVLIVDPASPRNVWPRGIILRVMPGQDGRIRVAEVQTKSGILRRPVARVVYIAIGNEC
ncbi:uncharacterized protein LOC124633081 [Helicoverpa zea]|uniref:uncharacterized protein LOC124633081 n=1 Tax=Helicoverpa zea TaxID=7113 RepID=UPI001F5628EC|nr:uncharacterized protein LOC124633081 [Helicoverpa zea]